MNPIYFGQGARRRMRKRFIYDGDKGQTRITSGDSGSSSNVQQNDLLTENLIPILNEDTNPILT